MGLLSSIKAQFRPTPEVLVSPHGEEPAPASAPAAAQTHGVPAATTAGKGLGDGDVERPQRDTDLEMNEKPRFVVGPVAETGVATVEAVQAVWGKRGRYIVIAGWDPSPFFSF